MNPVLAVASPPGPDEVEEVAIELVEEPEGEALTAAWIVLRLQDDGLRDEVGEEGIAIVGRGREPGSLLDHGQPAGQVGVAPGLEVSDAGAGVGGAATRGAARVVQGEWGREHAFAHKQTSHAIRISGSVLDPGSFIPISLTTLPPLGL